MEKRAELYALPGEQRRTPCSPWRTETNSMLCVMENMPRSHVPKNDMRTVLYFSELVKPQVSTQMESMLS
jgi:hypothetical protein